MQRALQGFSYMVALLVSTAISLYAVAQLLPLLPGGALGFLVAALMVVAAAIGLVVFERTLVWNARQRPRREPLPTPISVREVSRQMGIEVRQLYLSSNQTTRQLGERWMAYRKRRRQANLEQAMPHLEAAGREVLIAGKSLNLREMTARVPTEVLSGVQGLYDVLRDVRSRVEMDVGLH